MLAFSIHYARKISQCAVLGLFLLTIQAAFADDSKISPDLKPLLQQPSNNINVIVQYNSQPAGGGGLLGGVVKLLDGVVNLVFSLIPAVAATLHPADVISLSNQSNVAYISLDRPLGASLDYSTGAVNAPAAWSVGLDGTGVGIAIIDSGIYSHPDLNGENSSQSRVVYRQSFIGGTQFDDFGHGTHVAGIAAGNGSLSSKTGAYHTYRGIAPNASVLDLRVLDANGSSNDSVVIAAIQKAVQLKNRYNVRVINLSLGRPIYEGCVQDPLCQAVEAAWKNGIVVVTAAGNLGRNGYATVLSPGNSPHAITVGAMKTEMTITRSDDLIASYSSKGPTYIDLTAKPDLVAPGNLVVSLLAPGSTLQAEYPGNVIPTSQYSTSSFAAAAPAYFRLSGTSMATPVVSGAAALMLQKDPSLSPDTIKARLMKTASKTFPLASTAYDPTTGQSYTSTYDMFTVGAGYLDIAAALANNDRGYGSATSPQLYYNQAQQTAVLVPNLLSTWWSGWTWNLAMVWGNTVLQPGPGGTIAVWGSGVAWGTSGQWGTAVAWGTGGTSSTAGGTAVAWGTSGNGEQ